MSEASEIFDMIRQAVAFSEPDCGIVFETSTFENETEYSIWFDRYYQTSWIGDDEFLNEFCSIWDMARDFVVNFENNRLCRLMHLFKYSGVVDVFRAVSESSSPEELRLRLTASGLL